MKRYMNPLGQPLIETAQGEYVLYVDYLEAMRHANNNVAEHWDRASKAETAVLAAREAGAAEMQERAARAMERAFGDPPAAQLIRGLKLSPNAQIERRACASAPMKG